MVVDQPELPILIRPFQSPDLPALGHIYQATVRAHAPAVYTPEQVEAWASFPDDEAFADFIERPQTFVAIDSIVNIVGFAGFESSGRIASLYVAADQTRTGIGSALLSHIIATAETQGIHWLWSEARFLSQKLFHNNGFQTVAAEYVQRNGVPFKRWIVTRRLKFDR